MKTKGLILSILFFLFATVFSFSQITENNENKVKTKEKIVFQKKEKQPEKIQNNKNSLYRVKNSTAEKNLEESSKAVREEKKKKIK